MFYFSKVLLGLVAVCAILLFGAILVLLILAGRYVYLRLSGNIHEVEKGLVYRSGQLSRARLDKLIRTKNLKTVVNLRGENHGSKWYQQELAATQARGVEFVDIALSAHNEPSADKIESLLDIFANAQRPLLFHCGAGADRAGLVAAMYQLVSMQQSATEAAENLSIFYGHYPWFGNKTIAMDHAFWRFAGERCGADEADRRRFSLAAFWRRNHIARKKE